MRPIPSLKNHLLIAMPGLEDPNFSRAVTLVCEHTPDGAMGIVINRPSDLSLRDVLAQMDIQPAPEVDIDQPVYFGGPVQANRGFILHEPIGAWESTLSLTADLALSTSRDILVALAENRGPRRALFALGYAGWAAGQLEHELAQNTWLSGPASTDVLFDTPAEARWQAAARLLGVDVTLLSSETGHA